MKRNILSCILIISLCLMLAGYALADMEPIPGLSEEAFAFAVGEDLVTLKPAAISLTIHKDDYIKETERYNAALTLFNEEGWLLPSADTGVPDVQIMEFTDLFYDQLNFLSLSPDARRLFMVTSTGMPILYDFETETFRLVAPDAGMDSQYFRENYHKLLQKPEEQGVVWSKDGKYIAMAYPNRILLTFQLGVNILLIDFEEGTARQLVKDLPYNASMFSNEYQGGFPFRAVFSDEEPIVYYEVYMCADEKYGHNEIISKNLETGETKTIASFAHETTSSDARLWSTERGFMHTITDPDPKGTRGITIRGLNGQDVLLARDPKDPFESELYPRLIDFAGNNGVLHSIEQNASPPASFIQLFHLDSLSSDLFNACIAIQAKAGSQERLLQPKLAEILDEKTLAFKQSALDQLEIPNNAALSPDGAYLLLAVSKEATHQKMYIYDFQRGVLGIVDLSEALSDESMDFAVFQSRQAGQKLRGLRWLGNNKLLIEYNGKYRVYELAVKAAN